MRQRKSDLQVKKAFVELAFKWKSLSTCERNRFLHIVCENPCQAARLLSRIACPIPRMYRRMLEDAACREARSAYVLLRNKSIKLSPKRRRVAEAVAVSSPAVAYLILRFDPGVSAWTRRMAVYAVCRSPKWAYLARRDIPGLPPRVNRRLEAAACRRDETARALRKLGFDDFHPKTQEVFDWLRLGGSIG